uniref:Chemokine-like protein TAFA-5 n=1 Tax=Salmo trutta TaxID=8032 RepID=A0A674DS36_SALTR
MPTTGYQNTTRISIHPFDRHFKSGNNEGYVETGLRSGKGMKKLSAGGGASLCCLLLLWVIYSHRLREGQLAVGTCEIVMLNRDSSVPRCTIARQTARCACRRGQIAGTTKARPACVEGFFANHGRRGTEGNQQANTFCVDSPNFFSNHYIPSLHKSEEPYYVTVHRCPY